MTNTSFLYASPRRERKKALRGTSCSLCTLYICIMWYNRKSRPVGFAVVNDQIARGSSHRARRSPAVRYCTASPVRRKETRAASRKSPAVQSLYPFPPHAARSRPPPMPPYRGIGGGRSCSAARRVLHTSPSGRGFQKAPRTGRQPAGGAAIRQKARKWLSAGLCCGSMRPLPDSSGSPPSNGRRGLPAGSRGSRPRAGGQVSARRHGKLAVGGTVTLPPATASAVPPP